MSTVQYSKKDVTFSFANGNTRRVSVGNFAPQTSSDVATFKAAVIAFNNSDVAKVNSTYFYEDAEGTTSPVTGITAANVVTTTKTPIYASSTKALQRALADDSAEGSEG